MSKCIFWLGIWADDSDNEEESGGKSYVSKKRPKNYSAPIDFVAGGVQQAGKKDKENGNVKEEKEESEDDAPTSSFKIRDSSDESEEELPRAGKLPRNN